MDNDTGLMEAHHNTGLVCFFFIFFYGTREGRTLHFICFLIYIHTHVQRSVNVYLNMRVLTGTLARRDTFPP